MICRQCGYEYEGTVCPICGAAADDRESIDDVVSYSEDFDTKSTPKAEKKPFYRRWWFIAAAVAALLAVVISLMAGRRKTEKIVWNELILSDQLPAPAAGTGHLSTNSDQALLLYLYEMTGDDYLNYVTACENSGFTIDSEKTGQTFKAYNQDGYLLYLAYTQNDNSLRIHLNAPEELSDIVWPTSSLGQKIPAPKSLIGNYHYEYEDSFYVFIGNTDQSAFQQYIAAVMEAGFTEDYKKSETIYAADNSEGDHISIRYEGNNLMSITAKVSDEAAESNASVERTDTEQ